MKFLSVSDFTNCLRFVSCLSVVEAYSEGDWNLQFRRSLIESEIEQWNELQNLLGEVNLNNRDDQITWNLDKKGFTTKFVYRFITFRVVLDTKMMDIWGSHLSLKVKVFIWLMFKGRIQVGDQLKRMNWMGNPNCKLCGQLETIDHLIFQCPLSHFLSCFI
ncbi:hypothetical protein GUJ93_ZPchr0013g37497 [Zizania palustris]|uniref:Reverse transcriptase zinc-binding domain-containing protein n=1 Tax=Zizania palustris TaxID=103762 RepID=A0A8J6BX89_ZIZPA|nr:hypothetical protein GUJ93_ZPchr0013g37497 [Zizania palustris]